MDNETHLGSYNRCNVILGKLSDTSKCTIKRCKREPKFMIFGDDGSPKSSRFFGSSCNEHLGMIVKRVWKDNWIGRKKMQARERKTKIEEAKQLLGIRQ